MEKPKPKPKGKTPSLLTMSTGAPTIHTCGKKTTCDRCDENVPTGHVCFQIPKQKGGFTARPIFCIECTAAIIDKTKVDLLAIEALVLPHLSMNEAELT
jgi:hypothetical protein